MSAASKDAGRAAYTNTSMLGLLIRAYNLDTWQIVAPGWFDSEPRYDVAVRIPEGATKEQFRAMMQSLLAERFHLAVHRETREIAAYELTLGKRGARLKETSWKEGASTAAAPIDFSKNDASGFVVLNRPSLVLNFQAGPKGPEVHVTALAQPLSKLAEMLSGQLRGPVADKTGLSAKYDFTLEYAPDTGPRTDDSGATMQDAIQEQLGLKLEATRGPVSALIVDSAEPPSAN